MDRDVFMILCRKRAKIEKLRAMRISDHQFIVPSRELAPGSYYTITVEGGHPTDCSMEGQQCPSFKNRLYCTHSGAVANSLDSRRRHPKREAMRGLRPIRKAELTSRQRTTVLAEAEAIIAHMTRQV